MEEQEIIQHFFHEHPLSWIPNLVVETEWSKVCYGCFRYFSTGEAVYGCIHNCGFVNYLHEDCAEMPRQIRHRVHPSHPLTQVDLNKGGAGIGNSSCAVCEWPTYGLGYICSRGCDLWIHLGCATVGLDAADEERENKVMKHQSHPQHELRFLRKKKRSCSFQCDACGTIEKGNSYICSICDYWIHESCASLPTTAPFPHHHNHSLSLSFYLPNEYARFQFTCGICSGALGLRRWVYHCHLCRYVVHIKCATNTSSAAAASTEISNESTTDDHKDIIKGPINDIYEEILKPFVKIVRGDIFIPYENDDEIFSGKYKFHKHDHSLSFTMFSSMLSSHDHNKEEDDDDDDGDGDSPRSELTCDGCIMPIHQKKQKSGTSCSYQFDNGYMSCGECKYFLHLACFNLPPELPSHPLHSKEDHKLALQNCGKLRYWSYCSVCNLQTNGLIYSCTECSFKLDIKCSSLPDTIKHACHPQVHHYLKLHTDNHNRNLCGVCYRIIFSEGFYKCDSCKFSVCYGCMLLPVDNKHRLEKHRLPLTYDAYNNHPSDFYCGSCEEQMNPRSWMYHCRGCDQSFHPKCFPTTSGEYRNINFGRQQYVNTLVHHPDHPLRFQLITKKKRCDLCRELVYERLGFQCATCNFVMCLFPCGSVHMDAFKTIE